MADATDAGAVAEAEDARVADATDAGTVAEAEDARVAAVGNARVAEAEDIPW